MSIDTGGVCSGASVLLCPFHLLVQATYDGLRGRLLLSNISRLLGGDLGVTAAPHNLNVVVDAVVHHWILTMTVGAGGQDGWGREMLHRADFLYTDDSLVASTDPVYMQGAFETLTGLFDRVGIRNFLGRYSRLSANPYAWLGPSQRRLTSDK